MLAELIDKTGIRKACIVDDANDIEPQVEDLTSLSEEWNNLLDDMPLNDDLMKDLFIALPSFDIDKFSIKDIDSCFIQALWGLKDKYQEISPIFEAYENTKLSDKKYVQTLQDILQENSFEVTKVGRDFSEIASESHIIFVDLFLYLDQTKNNLEYTINILKNIVLNRGDNPPIIILISRSNRLAEYGEKFRDDCGIMESGFRIYKKVDLENKNKVLFCIKKLLEHYEDSIKVLRFLNSWEQHANKAVSETVSSLKKLDLLDHNMVHSLLLEEEGQSSASYFMDLFDSVLLHNFESQSDIIDSAKSLNQIDFNRVPTIQGLQKEPLQDLVFKSAFMGSERCKISDDDAIELGDIFKLKSKKVDENDLLQACTDENSIWLVITPSCDLVRNGISNIGLLKGTLTGVSYENWQTDTKINTPIIKINDISYSVKWDIKSFITYPKSSLQDLLNKDVYCRAAKMREINTLGLQQRFTSDYSRIGQRAVLPSVFKSSICLHYLDTDGQLIKFESQEESKGLFYVGATSNKVVNFSHIDYENILSSFEEFDVQQVHSQARKNVQSVKENPYILIEALESGLEIGSNPKEIKSDGKTAIAKIIFGEPNDSVIKKLKGVGLIFVVKNLVQKDPKQT